MTHIRNFFLQLNLLCFLKTPQSQFTKITTKLLYQNRLLELIQFSPHNSKPHCLYDVPFNLFFLYPQHLCRLCVTGLLNVLEKPWNRLDSYFSFDFLFLQVELLPHCDLVQSWDVASHSCLQQSIQFMWFERFLVQQINGIIIKRVTVNGPDHQFCHCICHHICLVDNI